MCGLVKLFLAALLFLWIYDYLLTLGDEVRDTPASRSRFLMTHR